MEILVAFQMLRQRLVDVSEVRITKTTMGDKKQGERYLVYLKVD
jgi:hypothetical protein